KTSDEELQALARAQMGGAEEALVERYVRLVRVCARPYFLTGGDGEDLIQEGMLGLLSAIRGYDPQKGPSFRAYAQSCIQNRIKSAIRSAGRQKHAPLNDGLPLDEVLSDESQSLGVHYFQQSPEEQVLARETEKELISAYSKCLSKFEAQILDLYLDGLSYEEMAALSGRDTKAVDNAIQRIRRKLAKLSSGENSAS
ncbi:MAG: sigma-70 family RNA polymerase sigma factor, partial [Oscillospiraceae bacterium]|nr:sigma-70 family RNA polymerase sigma factor [Oscillospiraceae bacterium]